MIRRFMRKLAHWAIQALLTGPAQGRQYTIIPQGWYHNSLVDGVMPQFIKIGRRFVSAPHSMIITHDASYFIFTNKYLIEPVEIGDDVFLGAGAIIMPGVKIGNRVVIGAGSIVTQNVPSGSVVAGNPARHIATIDEYIEKAERRGVLYPAPYTMADIEAQLGKATQEQVTQLQQTVLNTAARGRSGLENKHKGGET